MQGMLLHVHYEAYNLSHSMITVRGNVFSLISWPCQLPDRIPLCPSQRNRECRMRLARLVQVTDLD